METLLIIDPVSSYPYELDFDAVHYFNKPSFLSKKGDYLWLIWLDNNTVKGMIELQQSPYNKDTVWLKFFEVTPQFKGQGFSKVMMQLLATVFKEKFPNKILERSCPSEEGTARLHTNLTKCFLDNSVPFRQSRLI